MIFSLNLDQVVAASVVGVAGLLMTLVTHDPLPPQTPEQRYERALSTLAPFSDAENAHTLLSLRDCLTPLQRAALEHSAQAQDAVQTAQHLAQFFALAPRCSSEGVAP